MGAYENRQNELKELTNCWEPQIESSVTAAWAVLMGRIGCSDGDRDSSGSDEVGWAQEGQRVRWGQLGSDGVRWGQGAKAVGPRGSECLRRAAETLNLSIQGAILHAAQFAKCVGSSSRVEHYRLLSARRSMQPRSSPQSVFRQLRCAWSLGASL